MFYLDCHTHLPERPTGADVCCCYNVIAGKDSFPEGSPVWLSCGIHPWYLDNLPDPESLLRHWLSHPSVCAVGEAGLDKRVLTSVTQQLPIFQMQAQLAEEFSKPLLIHCVKAWSELITLKRSLQPKQPWIIHGFHGKASLAQQLLAHGFTLSFGPHFQPEAVWAAASQGFLAETDDSGADIRKVYAALADTLQRPVEQLPIKMSLILPSLSV
ncbi:MAG: TatD family hydrolase [Parabacteroides sp.]